MQDIRIVRNTRSRLTSDKKKDTFRHDEEHKLDKTSGNCTKLHPAWFYLTTETTFPATPGNLIKVKCPDGFINQGSETITCQNGKHYKFDNEPRCEAQGKKT